MCEKKGWCEKKLLESAGIEKQTYESRSFMSKSHTKREEINIKFQKEGEISVVKLEQ